MRRSQEVKEFSLNKVDSCGLILNMADLPLQVRFLMNLWTTFSAKAVFRSPPEIPFD